MATNNKNTNNTSTNSTNPTVAPVNTRTRESTTQLTPDVNGRTFKAAVIYHFYYDANGKTVIQFRGDNGEPRSALIHPAIRVLPIMHKAMVLTVNDACKPWKCTMRPSAEELNAYEARRQPKAKAYEKVELSQADIAFTESF